MDCYGSKMSNKNFGFGTQIRKSPYFDSTVKWGATGFSVYNHMYIPRDFGNPEQNFWNLIEKAKKYCLCTINKLSEEFSDEEIKLIFKKEPEEIMKATEFASIHCEKE